MATLPIDNNRKEIQLFKPIEIASITNPTTIAATDHIGVMFQDAITFYIGTASTSVFALPALTPLAIPDGGMTVTTSTVALYM